VSTMTEQSTQVYSVFVRTTPEQLWDAITKPEFTSKYFYGSLIESTWEQGAAYAGWAGDRSQQYVDGEVIEASPEKKQGVNNAFVLFFVLLLFAVSQLSLLSMLLLLVSHVNLTLVGESTVA